jgi:hypothetical protein
MVVETRRVTAKGNEEVEGEKYFVLAGIRIPESPTRGSDPGICHTELIISI